VLLLALLAIVFRRPALDLAVCGTAFTLGLVVFSFHTPFNVALLCGFDGILTTLPLVLVIFAGILLSSLLMAMGSLQRIVDWLMGGVRNGFHRSLVITLGVGNFTEGAGVIAEPLVAPMLRAAGVEPPGAAALSIVGYAGLMTLEMAGIVITVLALVTGIPIADLGTASAWLSIPATLAMALCIPLFLPRPLPEPRQWLLLVLCGLLVGFAALAAVTWLAVSISGMAAGLVLILALMLIGSRRLNLRSGILRDLAPLLFILGALLALNTVSPLKELTFHKLSVGVHLIPVHTVVFRPLFSAYLYLFLAFLLATRLFHIGPQQLKALLATGLQRGWRPSLAMGLFGAMGQMIAYSG
jgi:lactate permease